MESGFYEGPLTLELQASDGLFIYYTLDGSEPGPTGLLYTDPLILSDPSPQSNVHSAREDITSELYHYLSPAVPVDKAVVLRAAAYDDAGNYSNTVTAVYFLDFERKNGYGNTAILSLVTEPGNLFDGERGIYIRGNESRNFPQKSFTLFSRKRYESQTFAPVFFDTGISYPDIILNNAIQLKKIFFFSLVEDRDISTQQHTPCQVFLNGEYKREVPKVSLILRI